MDVTPDAVAALHAATGAELIIHGHTHRPALHLDGDTGRRRYVLPDWELDADPVRGGWIAIDADGSITRHGLDGQRLYPDLLEVPAVSGVRFPYTQAQPQSRRSLRMAFRTRMFK